MYRFCLIIGLFFLASCHHVSEDKPYTISQALIHKQSAAFPPPKVAVSSKTEKPLIVIDAGHGAEDKGAQRHASDEKKLALTTALFVKHHLTQKGYRVLLTRNRDVFIPLEKRAMIANQSNCAAFISIHYNTAPSEEAHGVEVYFYHKGEKKRQDISKKLATDVIHNVVKATGARSRGVKHGNFCVIRETTMPAILVEGGFMSNEGEMKKLRDNRYLEKLAEGIATGVDHFFLSQH